MVPLVYRSSLRKAVVKRRVPTLWLGVGAAGLVVVVLGWALLRPSAAPSTIGDGLAEDGAAAVETPSQAAPSKSADATKGQPGAGGRTGAAVSETTGTKGTGSATEPKRVPEGIPPMATQAGATPPSATSPPAPATQPALRPVAAPPAQPPAATQPVIPTPTVSSPPALPEPDPTAARARDETRSGNAQIEVARRQYDAGEMLAARSTLNALLAAGRLAPAEDREARALLTRIADETVFGRRAAPDDPLIDAYTVQPGDVLINIGKRNGVPAEAIMAMNGITDARRIRAGQKLKLPRQPFHARIVKSQFRLDVYLGDQYLRSYRVGLGAEGGTPEGVWRVKDRLANPTYYPSESSPHKRIIPPDDPNNPLGEYWIGLEGVDGGAVGQVGYGIHGTIEPESIGKAVSLGCVRMLNEDVAFLFKLMQPGKSTVTIVP
ncbi:MAG: L,D-transpeptidase family protein [Phycisphaerales bacterium]|nr:L,D-transpeptidase family protein [Phycisphaerales bacterium]